MAENDQMAESHNHRTHASNLVLDIGEDVGALVLYTGAELNGEEIELSRAVPGAKRFHNQVHERRLGGQTVFAAVYPEIRAGEYHVWRDGIEPADVVTIRGGAVAEIDWR